MKIGKVIIEALIMAICFSACSKGANAQPSQQATLTPLPTLTATPTVTPTPTFTPEPTATPTQAPEMIWESVTDDEMWWIECIEPNNEYEVVMCMTVKYDGEVVTFYMGYCDGEWVLISYVNG